MMVEGEMDEVSEAEMLEGLRVAHDAIRIQCQAQIELAAELGVIKREYCHEENDEDLKKEIWAKCYDKAYVVATSCNARNNFV